MARKLTRIMAFPERAGALVTTLSGWKYRVFVFLLGASTGLSFAPVYFFPAFFIAFPLLLLLLSRTSGKGQAFRLGWLFGFGHFLAGLYWIAESFYAQAAVPPWLGPVAVVILTAAIALFPAIALFITRIFWRDGISGILLFSLIWAGSEWLRGHILTGFPWNLSAHIWGFSDVMLQPLALLGSYGYSLLTIWFAAMPALFFFRHRLTPAIKMSAAIPPVLFAFFLVFGLWRISGAEVGDTGLKVRIVQPNIRQIDKWDPEKRPQNFARYLTMSAVSGEANPPDIIVWPEAAVPYILTEDANARQAISTIIPPAAILITGAPRYERQENGGIALWNSLSVLDSGGRILASYDKTHLVPFGEYLPLRSFLKLFGLDKLTQGAVDFSPGPGLASLQVGQIPAFSPLICYEIIFPGAVVSSLTPRPAWLLNITNDAWFGSSSGPHQHFALSRMRAIEEGLPLVRSAGTGISAIIDPYGRITGKIGLNKSGILDGSLPSPLAVRTLFDRFGDAILFIVVLAMAIPALIATRLKS